ncbi:FecCD family ABC transporter permease [Macrococcus armenti]|uniref:FecCD family ABC transporter permease n=1 Tax=Macrococcus armenti TaxID=2875764 RepID=UPI001CC925E0|nr:iron ABC transporter permease [Macrococcus armenti]UBH08764.1 iron ABC transporter permease [Macrococcus armenti]UBH11061.1 iron ABC transporter permease [Macrococcus armenti]UBH15540.1 iron ABC transporter permease [Macrococcus armenti]UBH17901.1 iron ABC transporter permease [Macrococcus armenti]UBH20166.1 iron ABC transporter permease [Macrococcus armenti]
MRYIAKQWFVLLTLLVFLAVIITLTMATGDFKMTPAQFIRTLFGYGDTTETMILYEFRLPRLLITVFSGIALALSGALLQSITKNPLADPGIMGINAGSGFFIALLMIFIPVDSNNFVYILPLLSMIGAIITVIAVLKLSYEPISGINPVKMILIGVGLSTALAGAMMMMTSTFNKEDVEFITKWLSGDIWGDSWPFVLMIATIMALTIPYIIYKLNVLNILNTHDHISTSVGIDLPVARRNIVIASVVLCASAVSVCGSIAFVGLISPHIARRLVGSRHQKFIPVTIVLGAILLSFADMVGRLFITATNIPAGIVVSIIGAPYFLYLMRKNL